jgi:hypothetical protein
MLPMGRNIEFVFDSTLQMKMLRFTISSSQATGFVVDCLELLHLTGEAFATRIGGTVNRQRPVAAARPWMTLAAHGGSSQTVGYLQHDDDGVKSDAAKAYRD